MKTKRIHAIIHGRVQGVFFRDYTQRQAQTLNLTGWVKNLPDRTVEAVFEGEPSKVDAMLNWLHTGSPSSKVNQVYSREEEATETYESFVIRYDQGT